MFIVERYCKIFKLGRSLPLQSSGAVLIVSDVAIFSVVR